MFESNLTAFLPTSRFFPVKQAHQGAHTCIGGYNLLQRPSSGNILVKSWLMHLNSTLAGVIMGARIPIALSSRGSSAEEKFYSVVMASILAGNKE